MTTSLSLASGRVFAEADDGAVRVLQNGTELAPGEVVVTGAASAAVFQVEGAGDVSLGASTRWDPAWGAPTGEIFQPATRELSLQTDELGQAAQQWPSAPDLDLAEIFAAAEAVPVAVPVALSQEEADTPSGAELVAELGGLLRALQVLSGSEATELLDLQNQLAEIELALTSEAAPAVEWVEQVFALLDRAGDLAFQEYARHAGEEVARLAGGEASLQAEEMMLGMPQTGHVSRDPITETPSDTEVLDASSVLEDLTVQPLGDLMHVENVAGATRMTVRDADEEDMASLWLDAPLGGMESLLGFDAPEFTLPDTA